MKAFVLTGHNFMFFFCGENRLSCDATCLRGYPFSLREAVSSARSPLEFIVSLASSSLCNPSPCYLYKWVMMQPYAPPNPNACYATPAKVDDRSSDLSHAAFMDTAIIPDEVRSGRFYFPASGPSLRALALGGRSY